MSEAEIKSESHDASLDEEEYILIKDGLKKKIIKEGYGEVPPIGSNVNVHYVGTLLDGTTFDSSRGKAPFSFDLGQGMVIKGWDEGVATMKIGEIADLLCAPDYAYGAQGSPPKIPPNSTLKFEVEVLGFTEPTDTPEKRIKVAMDKKEEGNKLFKEGSFDDAKMAYKKGKELVQNMWADEGEEEVKAKDLTVALGSNITMCALKLGEYSDAISEGKEVLKLDPQNIKTIWRLGQAYMHIEEYETGAETVQKGLEIVPDDQNLKAILALIHKKQAEYQKKEKNLYGKMFGGL